MLHGADAGRRSRITWIVVHEGQPYIPCGTPGFSLWKQWPADPDMLWFFRMDPRPPT
jgi:hypothetical protein